MTATYLDIAARPDADTTSSILLSGLFEQLHREFVAREMETTGVSFPEAKSGQGLGTRLRLHGPKEETESLSRMPWLARVSDYYKVGEPRHVPIEHSLRIVKRVQPKLSAAKVRRLLARNAITEERAGELLDGKQELDAPFVQIRSSSSGQRFRLFFEQLPAEAPSRAASFNAYGFGSTIPWF